MNEISYKISYSSEPNFKKGFNPNYSSLTSSLEQSTYELCCEWENYLNDGFDIYSINNGLGSFEPKKNTQPQSDPVQFSFHYTEDKNEEDKEFDEVYFDTNAFKSVNGSGEFNNSGIINKKNYCVVSYSSTCKNNDVIIEERFSSDNSRKSIDEIDISQTFKDKISPIGKSFTFLSPTKNQISLEFSGSSFKLPEHRIGYINESSQTNKQNLSIEKSDFGLSGKNSVTKPYKINRAEIFSILPKTKYNNFVIMQNELFTYFPPHYTMNTKSPRMNFNRNFYNNTCTISSNSKSARNQKTQFVRVFEVTDNPRSSSITISQDINITTNPKEISIANNPKEVTRAIRVPKLPISTVTPSSYEISSISMDEEKEKEIQRLNKLLQTYKNQNKLISEENKKLIEVINIFKMMSSMDKSDSERKDLLGYSSFRYEKFIDKGQVPQFSQGNRPNSHSRNGKIGKISKTYSASNFGLQTQLTQSQRKDPSQMVINKTRRLNDIQNFKQMLEDIMLIGKKPPIPSPAKRVKPLTELSKEAVPLNLFRKKKMYNSSIRFDEQGFN